MVIDDPRIIEEGTNDALDVLDAFVIEGWAVVLSAAYCVFAPQKNAQCLYGDSWGFFRMWWAYLMHTSRM